MTPRPPVPSAPVVRQQVAAAAQAAAAAISAAPAPTRPRTAAAELVKLLQPALKAWLFGYAFDYIPAILKLLLRFVLRQSRALVEVRKRNKEARQRASERGEKLPPLVKSGPWQAIRPALKAAPQLFVDAGKAAIPPLGPSGTAALSFLAMATYAFSDSFFWWPILKRYMLARPSFPHPGSQAAVDTLRRTRVAATFISASLASALSITYLQQFGPTLDLTLFAFVRGLDTFVRAAPLVWKAVFAPSPEALAKQALTSVSTSGIRSAPKGAFWYGLAEKFGPQADGLVFVVCCAQIMWAWFYYPQRLPPTYSKWISNLACMDDRLLKILRCRRTGIPHEWSYIKKGETDPEAAELGGSLAESLGYPYAWGDPGRVPHSGTEAQQWLAKAKSDNVRKAQEQGGRSANELTRRELEDGFVFAGAGGPRGRGQMGGIPCELVHCGMTRDDCVANAALRWWNGWKMCMRIYVPVHLLPKVLLQPRRALQDPVTLLKTVAWGSARSASFLATFITSIWFSVCFVRSLVLPRLFPHVSHQYWDAGLGPLLGSWLCGFSVFLEEKRKRAEMALYVAPRALFALAESVRPGWLSKGGRSAQWTERVIFGLSLGMVISAARHRPDLLRGITAILSVVVRPASARRRQELAAAV